MYVVEIMNVVTKQTLGEPIFTGSERGLQSLQDGIREARRRIRERGLDPAEYKILPRIVGCL